MTHFPHGAMIAVHAAEEERKKLEQEEEEMTTYTSNDLDNDWEFKIVRVNNNAFRQTEMLQLVTEEEAMAGWEMLEKLDDQRIRLKRLTKMRRRDIDLPQDVDPYRTNYGTSQQAIGLIMAGLFMLSIFIGIGVLIAVTN